METPLLSICIATYNDPKGLERALKSITPQATSEVEIFVRDDSSNDETEKLIKRYQEKTSIRYVHGEKIGLDGAIAYLTAEAKGKYIWWFGDDILREKGVAHVLEIVKKHPDLSFIWANFQVPGFDKPTRDLGGDRFFKDRDEVIQEIKGILGFISGTIFRKEIALPGLEPAEKYRGTAFLNLYLVMYILSRGTSFYFLQGPYVLWQAPTTEHFYDGFPTFAVHFYNITTSFGDRFDKKVLRSMLARNIKNVLKGIVAARAKGHKTGYGNFSAHKLWVLFKLYWSFPIFWLLLPLLVLPRFVVKCLYLIYKWPNIPR